AVVIGDVVIGERCWIGPNTTIRSDFHKIRIGDCSDVQDNCVIHGETVLGSHARLGHGAIVHGATLGKNVLVAMNAVVLDRASLGDGVVVAAGAVVAQEAQVPSGKLVMGVPAAIVGDAPPVRDEGVDEGYVGLIGRYKTGLREVSLRGAEGHSPAGDSKL
ncbi:MAG: gamma carbonic anhydrase family protein, partial [Dehalococcoidia bacterium]